MAHLTPLEPGRYYHLYNRGNNRENLFREERNYAYFLKLYAYHVLPVADIYAYCLLSNHFHMLIRMKGADETPANCLPSRSFSNFFNAYAKAMNKAYGRTGALFQRPFRRIEVTNDGYFARVVRYIHLNPQKHGFVRDFRDWPFSSYHALVSNKSTRLAREAVLARFGGVVGFKEAHRQLVGEVDVEEGF